MSSTPSKRILFIFEEPQSTDERLKNLARSRAQSHVTLWYHCRRRERQAIEARLAPSRRRASTCRHSCQKYPHHLCKRGTDQEWRDYCPQRLPSPAKLFSTWTSSDLNHCYSDIDFYVHEIAPQFHLTYKIFDVYDIYQQYLLRPISKLARMTWQCNIASFRTKNSPSGGVYYNQYYQRYGEVLSAYRKKLLDMNHARRIDEELLETMIMLINVAFMTEGRAGGDIHLRRLLDLLRENRNELKQHESLFLQCLLRQWHSHWKIVRGSTGLPACVKDFCYHFAWREASSIHPAETSTSLTGGFRHLADAQRLSGPTIRILVRMTSYLLPQEHSPSLENTQIFQDFEDSCPCLRSKDPTFEKLLCSTIMIYYNLVSSPNGRGCEWTLMFGARRNLLTDALTARPTPHPAEKACFMWIIATVAVSWSGKLEDVGDKTAALFDCLLHIFSDLSWTDFITTVRHFIWDERFTPQLLELWSAYDSIQAAST